MSYECKILLDSISETGKRLTTFQITFPRCVLAEAETHRVLRGWGGNVEELIINNLGINVDENLSRNSASSRAIPISKMVQMVRETPFIPEKWGKPVKGMGAKEYWEAGSTQDMDLTRAWDNLRNEAINFAVLNADIGNKEDLNRALEPFMWHTAIITATEFSNFFKLRTNPAADWKIRRIADLMYEAYHNNYYYNNRFDQCDKVHAHQQKLKVGEWHCPLVSEEDDELIFEYGRNNNYILKPELYDADKAFIQKIKKEISVARCARVSYLTHDGKRDIEKDLELFERLRTSGHWSPFEHVATPYFDLKTVQYGWCNGFVVDNKGNMQSGNFIGWKQYRKEFQDENCTSFRKEN
jgi:hypothetical protein